MFSLFKKNNPRNMNYNGYYPNYNEPLYNNYDLNLIDTKLNELTRQVNDLQKRMARIEQYLGIINSNYPNF